MKKVDNGASSVRLICHQRGAKNESMISHAVGGPRNVISFQQTVEVPLVEAAKTKQVCFDTQRSGRAFVAPSNSGGLVTKQKDRPVSAIALLH